MHNSAAGARQSSRLIMLLGSLALALFFAFLTAWGWQQRENQWAQYLDTQAEVQRLAVLQAQFGLEQQALLLAEQLAADATTQRLTRELARHIADDGQQDPQVSELRRELQGHLHPHWQALRARGANQLPAPDPPAAEYPAHIAGAGAAGSGQ